MTFQILPQAQLMVTYSVRNFDNVLIRKENPTFYRRRTFPATGLRYLFLAQDKDCYLDA